MQNRENGSTWAKSANFKKAAAQADGRRRAVGYIRVSTEGQAQDGVSLAAQQQKIEAFAALYKYEMVAIIDDPGASAKTLDRPGLQKALQMLY